MQKNILLATTNQGKIREISQALKDYGLLSLFNLKTLHDFDSIVAPEETGDSFLENALIKARYYSKKMSLPVLTDDSGLVVPSLNGEPGVYSGRYSGNDANDDTNMDLLLKNLASIEDKKAFMTTSLVFYINEDSYFHTDHKCHGEIINEKKGSYGFGYSPIFLIPSLNKCLAEIPLNERADFSHRQQALKKMLPIIEEWLKKNAS